MVAHRLKKVLTPPVVVAGAILFLVEEVLWARLGQLMAALGRWAPVAWLEARIRRLPPYVALVLFIVPWAIILPVKLAAVWLAATGHALTGVLLFAGGEVFGVGVLARLYALCRPTLGSLTWFVRVERLVLRASAWAHDRLERVVVWRESKRLVLLTATQVKALFAGTRSGWLASRLRAAQRMVKAQVLR